MAASNRHRRLIEDPTQNPFCSFQCDPQRNPTGLCIAFCAATCPSFCHIIHWSPPPSSSPSPANSPYSQTTLALPATNHPYLSFHFNVALISLVLVATFMLALYKIYTVRKQSRHGRRTLPLAPPPENQETVENDALYHPIWYIRTTGLERSDINAITIMKFKKGDGVVVGSHCSVCLSEFEVDETLRILPICKHGFHISCIDTWLRSHINCPLCRAGVINSTVDPPSPAENADFLRFNAETSSRVSVDEREEGIGSSEVRIGEADEDDDLNGNSEFLLIRSSVSVEDFAVSVHRGTRCQSVDGASGIELVKIEQNIRDNNSSKESGS